MALKYWTPVSMVVIAEVIKPELAGSEFHAFIE
jgi:hypothetical protein